MGKGKDSDYEIQIFLSGGRCDEKVCVQEKRVEERHCPQPQPLSCFCNLECKIDFKFLCLIHLNLLMHPA